MTRRTWSTALKAAQDLAQSLPDIRRLLDSDVLAAYQGDPAAEQCG